MRPGRGKTVCRGRYVAAAIAVSREAKAARLTPEQAAERAAILATLPRVSREEIEACRTPAGGYSFTRERLASWGVPWPPPSGWRKALLRGENDEPKPTAAAHSPVISHERRMPAMRTVQVTTNRDGTVALRADDGGHEVEVRLSVREAYELAARLSHLADPLEADEAGESPL
ncbi:MAG: hypothetical protein WAK82_25040 [Streptosporangiaceae bacterium]